MPVDLKSFASGNKKFTVDHDGQSMEFFAKQISVKEFAAKFKSNNAAMDSNMKRTFSTLLLDENEQPLSRDWLDELMSSDALLPLALKINNGINEAIGLDELAGKKG